MDIYQSRINSFNFKGSLSVVVRAILEIYCHYSQLMENSEFKIGTFLSVYTNRTPNFKYRAYVECYNKQCPTKLKISYQLAEDMRILNALTSSSNHDTDNLNQVAGRVYKPIIDEFFNHPSPDYYRIFSSYIRFIALNTKDDRFCIALNNVL